LRDLVAEGQVQAVLVYGPDRLSRKYAYQVILLEEFSRQGVETVFLQGVSAQTPEERLLVQFQGMIAEYERAQIAERSRRGKRYRAKVAYSDASRTPIPILVGQQNGECRTGLRFWPDRVPAAYGQGSDRRRTVVRLRPDSIPEVAGQFFCLPEWGG
jgi:hypothetical protein